MLNTMRSHAGGIFAKILLTLLILSFAVWGIEDMLRSGGSSGPLATVGSSEISRLAFERAYQREMDQARTSMGKSFSPELVKMLGLDRQVLEQMITAELLAQETARLGLLPGDEAIARDIRINPSFRNEKGEFDKAVFDAVLRRSGYSERAYVDEVRRTKATQLLLETVASAAPVNDVMLSAQLEADAEQRIADVYILSPSAVPTPAPPDDAMLKAYYEKNSVAYMKPEYRELSYVTVRPEQMAAAVTVTEEELKAAYDERAKLFGGDAAPFASVRDALEKELKMEKAGEASSGFSAKLEDLLAGGSTLAEAAKELNLSYREIKAVDAQGNTPSGGKADLPAYDNFLEAAFKAADGTESPLIKASDGTYFLVRVENVTREQPEPLEQVKDKVLAAYKKQETSKALQALAEATAKAMREEGKDASEVVNAKGFFPVSTGKIKRNDSKTAGGQLIPVALVRELFTLPEGKSTLAYPGAEGKYLIGVLKERIAPVNVSPNTVRSSAEGKQLLEKSESLLRRELLEEYVLALRKQYDVQVNDAALQAITATAQE